MTAMEIAKRCAHRVTVGEFIGKQPAAASR